MTDKKPSPKHDITPPNSKSGKKSKAPEDEKGGFKDLGLLEPTRYGDWESNGRCTDF